MANEETKDVKEEQEPKPKRISEETRVKRKIAEQGFITPAEVRALREAREKDKKT